MNYSEICDEVMECLREVEVDEDGNEAELPIVGIPLTSIVEGGREMPAPSLNVFISPAVDLGAVKAPTLTAPFVLCLVEIVAVSGAKSTDADARREAMELLLKACEQVNKLGLIDGLQDIGFAETNADAAVATVTFITTMEFV